MPQFTFIVPVYNVKLSYLTQCINSITRQTFPDIEIILVDDCSQDTCAEYCDEICKTDARIKVIHQNKNKGVSAARNIGIDYSKGKWISFVDADDWIEETYCEVLNRYIEKEIQNIDAVFFSGKKSYPNLEEEDSVFGEVRIWHKEDIEELQISIMSSPLKNTPSLKLSIESVWGKIFDRDFLVNANIRMRSIPYREDGLFIQEILEHASNVVQVPDRLYHYRMTKNSVVNSYRPHSPEEQRNYLDLLFKFASDNSKNNENYTKALYCAALLSGQIVITNYYFNSNNAEKYRERQKQCMRYLNQQPYCDIFKHVQFTTLKRNHMIKAVCIKIGWYAGVSILRNVYMSKKNHECYE